MSDQAVIVHWFLVAVSAATFIGFGAALHHFFVQARQVTPPLRFFQDANFVFGALHVVALLLAGEYRLVPSVIGAALYVLSISLFLSSIEAARRVALPRALIFDPRPVVLVTHGPFRWIRHPIYVSYSLAWIAAPIALLNVWLAIQAAVWIGLYVFSARREEQLLEASELGGAYKEYKARTAALIPGLW